MKIEKNDLGGGWLSISLSGDIETIGDTRDLYYQSTETVKEGHRKIVLDCTGITYAGSSFISKVLLLRGILEEQKGSLAVINSQFTKDLFETTGHTAVLKTYGSLEDFQKANPA